MIILGLRLVTCLILYMQFQLQKAIEEERYEDATFLRDQTGAGLVSFLRNP